MHGSIFTTHRGTSAARICDGKWKERMRRMEEPAQVAILWLDRREDAHQQGRPAREDPWRRGHVRGPPPRIQAACVGAPRVLRRKGATSSARLPTGSADNREKDSPGPETTDPGQAAADLTTGHRKSTNAAAGRCDLNDLGADGLKKWVEEGDRRSARPPVTCSPWIWDSPARCTRGRRRRNRW